MNGRNHRRLNSPKVTGRNSLTPVPKNIASGLILDLPAPGAALGHSGKGHDVATALGTCNMEARASQLYGKDPLPNPFRYLISCFSPSQRRGMTSFISERRSVKQGCPREEGVLQGPLCMQGLRRREAKSPKQQNRQRISAKVSPHPHTALVTRCISEKPILFLRH